MVVPGRPTSLVFTVQKVDLSRPVPGTLVQRPLLAVTALAPRPLRAAGREAENHLERAAPSQAVAGRMVLPKLADKQPHSLLAAALNESWSNDVPTAQPSLLAGSDSEWLTYYTTSKVPYFYHVRTGVTSWDWRSSQPPRVDLSSPRDTNSTPQIAAPATAPVGVPHVAAQATAHPSVPVAIERSDERAPWHRRMRLWHWRRRARSVSPAHD